MTTGNTINENTITNIIEQADKYIYKRLHDYDELEYGTEVMRIGCDGYIPYGEWNKAFTGMPEWAKDAYIILGNDAKPMNEVVEHANAGDLSEWWDKEQRDALVNDPDLYDRMLCEVYFTEIGD